MKKIAIPGYEMLELIASGGMAEVWKARQLSLDRIVAIKLLSSAHVESNADIDRFRFEAQATARLKHQGIIQIYDAGVADGMYYIAMEYVAGYTVGDWCRRKGRLDEKDVLLVAECVADALEYAWNEAGIMHCDIKPDNVIIDADGTLKVADLGLARTIHAVGVEEGAVEVLGTPNYISPEQSAGRADLDCRTDIYALGASLYYLATGKLFFQDRPASEVMDLQISDHVPDPHDLNPALSLGLCWLIEKLTAKEPQDRSRDWEDVLADIGRVKQGKFPIPLPRDGASTVLRSAARGRHTVPSRTARISHASAERARASVQGNQAKGPRTLWLVAGVLVLLGVVAFFLARSRQDSEESRHDAPAPSAIVPPAPTAEDIARDAYNGAVAWRDNHAAEFDAAIQRFEAARSKSGGTSYEPRLESAIGSLRAAKTAAVAAAWSALEGKVRELMGTGAHAEALAVCMDESRPFAQALQAQRRALAEEVRRARTAADEARQKEIDAARAAPRESTDELLARAADRLFANDLAGAIKSVNSALALPGDEAKRTALRDVHDLLRLAREEDARILHSFDAQVGRVISVEMTDGAVTATVRRVTATGVEIQRAITADGVPARLQLETVGMDRLAGAELIRRLGSANQPSAQLRRGMLSLQAGVPALARRYFSQVGTALEEMLLERVELMRTAAHPAP